MNELLKALYDHFYEPLPETELRKEIEDCHQKLMGPLQNEGSKKISREATH